MTIDVASRVLSVNLARVRPNPHQSDVATTGIDKAPTSGSVLVRAPGTKRDGLGSGLVGDQVCDRRNHGGDDRAYLTVLAGWGYGLSEVETLSTVAPTYAAPAEDQDDAEDYDPDDDSEGYDDGE